MKSFAMSARPRGIVFAASLLVILGATGPVLASEPCKSDDPLDFEEALRHVDCGETDDGWGVYDYEKQMERIPDTAGQRAIGAQPASYNHLPTTFSAWFDTLNAAERRQLANRFAQEAGYGGGRLSDREIDAVITLVIGQVDDAFDAEGLTANERRRAIVEIAENVGLSVEPKRGAWSDYGDFGRGGSANDIDDGFVGWEPVDPTGDFGRPSNNQPKSDLDLLLEDF